MDFETLNIDNIPQEIKIKYDILTDDLKKVFEEFLDPDWEHTPEQAMEEVDAMIEINNLPDNYKDVASHYLRKPHPAYPPKEALEEVRALQEISNLSQELQNQARKLLSEPNILPTKVLEQLQPQSIKE